MTISQNKISVVVPNYNYSQYITRRLKSIFNQTYPIYELIILDDHSTDNSVEIFQRELARIHQNLPKLKIKTFFNSENSGSVCEQWQKGFQEATGDLVWIAEMDDLADPDFLKTVIAPMQQDAEVILSYSNSKIVNPEGKIVFKRSLRQFIDSLRSPQTKQKYIHNGKDELAQSLCIYNTIPNVSAVVFRQNPEIPNILEKSATFKIAGDWYLYSQLALAGKIAYTPEKLNFYCVHPGSVTKAVDHQRYFLETQKMHQIISQDIKIPDDIQAKIIQHEEYLKNHWHLFN